MITTRQANWPLRFFLLAVMILIGLYVAVGPLVSRGGILNSGHAAKGARFAEPLAQILVARVLESLIAVWMFTFGACVGSFLNVVVYRLPRGITLLGTSRCPRCQTAILFRDNIPVLGWIKLRGCCRSCGLPISARYPIVEAIAGSILLALAWVELFTGADNLLKPSPWPNIGVILFVAEPDWGLVLLFAFHGFLLAVLLAAALIRLDDQPLPRSLLSLAIALGLLGPLFWPTLHPIEWLDVINASPPPLGLFPRLAIGLVGVLGALVGLAIGGVVDAIRRWRLRDVRGWQPDATAGFGIAGLFLGGQAVLSIATLAMAIELGLVALLASPRRGWSWRLNGACVLVAVCLQLGFWRRLSQRSWWPGSEPQMPAIAAALAFIFIAAIAIHTIHGSRRAIDSDVEIAGEMTTPP